MSKSVVDVLLLGKSESSVSNLLEFLEQRGCHCSVVSHLEAAQLPEVASFDLILSTTPLRQTEPLVLKLSGAPCAIFYEFAVEDGCWWVPLDGETRKCLGRPALRSHEFAGFLEKAVKRIRERKAPPGKRPSERDKKRFVRDPATKKAPLVST
jgi:hypothetical protein